MHKSTEEIILHDISNTITDRLQLWITDSLDLYKMVGQSRGTALAVVLKTQAAAICALANLAELSKEELLDFIAHYYDLYTKLHNNQEERP